MRTHTIVGLLAGVLLLGGASSAFAQTTTSQTELQDTIRTELLQDSRTAHLPPAQLEAMVQALAAQAQKQGVSAQQIAWRPNQKPDAASAADTCASDSFPGVCAFARSLGLSGSWPFVSAIGAAIVVFFLLLGGIFYTMHKRTKGLPIRTLEDTQPSPPTGTPSSTL